VVGATTIINDNPELTTRNWPGSNPLRVVLDPAGILSPTYKVFDSASPTWIYTRSGARFQDVPGVTCMLVPSNPDHLPHQVIHDLHQHHIQSITVEGGKMTLDAFIRQGLWDEARIFTGAMRFGHGIPAPELRGIDIARFNPGTDTLRICINPEQQLTWPL
jgi:diaminohydroxyphosphoribosylaminopyrimidine deaminase / 5-amino-6-(5-phosphoribosylamino)uracil reductase